MFFWTRELAACARPAWGPVRGHLRAVADPADPDGRPSSTSAVVPRPASVEANRNAVAEAFDVPRDRLLFMNQCHGADVVRADGPWTGDAPSVDAVVTARDDLALAALSADCVPVLLADPVAGVVGAVHAGRPGMVARVVERALDALLEAGATPGPTPSPSSVRRSAAGATRSRRVCAPRPPRSAPRARRCPGPGRRRSTSPPASSTSSRLVAVPVTWVPGCTRESPELYSYRRDRTTGRFAGIVRLLPPSAP